MDFRELFKNASKNCGSNLTIKIGNPPKLQTMKCFCLWSDLLGFGDVFERNNWELTDVEKRQIYERLGAAHSNVLYYSDIYERVLILNDGIAKVFHPHNKGYFHRISYFIRSCVYLHNSINETEHENKNPGCRSVLTFGENIEYLEGEIRLDDYIMNYTKPQGAEISNIVSSSGNPIIVYNPKELQMNTAFSKAFLLDEGGTKAGLPGNNFYVDQSVVNAIIDYSKEEGYTPMWEEKNEELFLFIPYEEGNYNKVAMGFCFDNKKIKPNINRYKTTVYKLKRFYPSDEKTSDFFINLEYSFQK